mmetsp:Transcript_60199/g.127524  ORF Transcript_60199/g.127524 Transcript_60199/m.127524 type:complete len:239 (+) Transcript_60199:128-844(+)
MSAIGSHCGSLTGKLHFASATFLCNSSNFAAFSSQCFFVNSSIALSILSFSSWFKSPFFFQYSLYGSEHSSGFWKFCPGTCCRKNSSRGMLQTFSIGPQYVLLKPMLSGSGGIPIDSIIALFSFHWSRISLLFASEDLLSQSPTVFAGEEGSSVTASARNVFGAMAAKASEIVPQTCLGRVPPASIHSSVALSMAIGSSFSLTHGSSRIFPKPPAPHQLFRKRMPWQPRFFKERAAAR